MKKTIHKANTRGFANHGWLVANHTFSFGNYQNPERMNFGMLRVFNDDVIQPKMGFGTHPHRNMEIITIPISGALSHKDNMNNQRSIEVDEIQVMSAGTGVTHSEFNDSKTEAANTLQLWIIPEKEEVTPFYDQKKFDASKRKNQQGYILMIDLDKDFETEYTLNNGAYFFLIDGEVEIADVTLEKRDAVGITDTDKVSIKAHKESKLLVIDVPMN